MEQESLSGSEFDCSVKHSRSSSSMQIEPVAELSTFVRKLCPLIDEMKGNKGLADLPVVMKAIESLESDYIRAKAAVDGSSVRTSPAKRIEALTQNLGRSLGLVLFASSEVSFCNKDKVEALCKEMMNARFEPNSDHESQLADEVVVMEETDDDDDDYCDVYDASSDDDETDEKGEDDIVEDTQGEDDIVEDTRLDILGIDDIFMLIRSKDEEKFRRALSGINALIMDGMVCHERFDEDIVRILHDRLISCIGPPERVTIIQVLRYLVSVNDENKVL